MPDPSFLCLHAAFSSTRSDPPLLASREEPASIPAKAEVATQPLQTQLHYNHHDQQSLSLQPSTATNPGSIAVQAAAEQLQRAQSDLANASAALWNAQHQNAQGQHPLQPLPHGMLQNWMLPGVAGPQGAFPPNQLQNQGPLWNLMMMQAAAMQQQQQQAVSSMAPQGAPVMQAGQMSMPQLMANGGQINPMMANGGQINPMIHPGTFPGWPNMLPPAGMCGANPAFPLMSGAGGTTGPGMGGIVPSLLPQMLMLQAQVRIMQHYRSLSPRLLKTYLSPCRSCSSNNNWPPQDSGVVSNTLLLLLLLLPHLPMPPAEYLNSSLSNEWAP